MTPAGRSRSELADGLGRSEEELLELLRPFLEAGIVAERGGRLVVADRLVRAAFGQEPASERVSEEALAGRITAYLERHRAAAGRARRPGRIAEGVTGDPAAIRALLHERAEYVNEGAEGWHCWALAAWAEELEEPAAHTAGAEHVSEKHGPCEGNRAAGAGEHLFPSRFHGRHQVPPKTRAEGGAPMPKPTPKRRPAAKPKQHQPAAKRQEEARPPAELLAEYERTMKANREGYLEYERAHLAMRAGKLAATKAARIKAEHREPHRLYWRAYERARALRKEAA